MPTCTHFTFVYYTYTLHNDYYHHPTLRHTSFGLFNFTVCPRHTDFNCMENKSDIHINIHTVCTQNFVCIEYTHYEMKDYLATTDLVSSPDPTL